MFSEYFAQSNKLNRVYYLLVLSSNIDTSVSLRFREDCLWLRLKFKFRKVGRQAAPIVLWIGSVHREIHVSYAVDFISFLAEAEGERGGSDDCEVSEVELNGTFAPTTHLHLELLTRDRCEFCYNEHMYVDISKRKYELALREFCSVIYCANFSLRRNAEHMKVRAHHECSLSLTIDLDWQRNEYRTGYDAGSFFEFVQTISVG